jgi:bacterioferritin-associated ferredoxin
MYVCVCHAVTDRAIRHAAQAGARSLAELAQTLRVATGCGKCAALAQDLLAAADRAVAAEPVALPLSADPLHDGTHFPESPAGRRFPARIIDSSTPLEADHERRRQGHRLPESCPQE